MKEVLRVDFILIFLHNRDRTISYNSKDGFA